MHSVTRANITTYYNYSPGIVHAPTYNWAFLDFQNVYQGIKKDGWKINWKSFREYLYETFNITKAVVFIGYVKENARLYTLLRKSGFQLEFKQTRRLANGQIDGGNIDPDLASYVMDNKLEYSKAVIVADDADYANMIKSLLRQNKLGVVISSHSIKSTSQLIKQIVGRDQLQSIHSLKDLIGRMVI
jgi:NYN domain-containing protein